MTSRVPALFRFVGHLCRLLLSGVFLLAGLLKALDPEGFTHEIIQYGIVAGAMARLLAYVLIPVEVVAGIALLINFRPVLSFSVAALLLLVFIGAVGFAIVTDQPLTECGCFGRNTPRTPRQTLVEDVGFLAAALVGMAALRGGPRPGIAGGKTGRWKTPVLAASALASGAFVFAAPGLPIDDMATALRPGVHWADLNVALAEVDLEKDAHLVVLMGMRDTATIAAVDRLNKLAASGRVPVVGLYEDDATAYNEFFWTRGPAFPLYHAAGSDLGRLHRRLPRLFLLRDGEVRATWNEVPTEEQIAKSLEG
jgi:uncharacterized membrane protein YphA (DoxX/SURF4 family)